MADIGLPKLEVFAAERPAEKYFCCAILKIFLLCIPHIVYLPLYPAHLLFFS